MASDGLMMNGVTWYRGIEPSGFFLLGKLRGMNEHEGRIPLNSSLGNSIQSLVQKVYMTGNLSQVPSTEDDLVR